jgi:hypothetical protein
MQEYIDKIRNHLQAHGYAKLRLADMLAQLRDVAMQYDKPTQAARLLADGFLKHISQRIEPKKFERFIKEIDPRTIELEWITEEIGFRPFDSARTEKYNKDMKDCRARLTVERRSAYGWLSCEDWPLGLGAYHILQPDIDWDEEEKIKFMQKILKEAGIQVEPLKPINTPMGGMPWYRLRQKRL